MKLVGEERLRAYWRALNEAYVTRDEQGLAPFYEKHRQSDDRQRWERMRRLDQERGAVPLASRLTVVPLAQARIGTAYTETAFALHHTWYYRQQAVLMQENRRIQRLATRRSGDDWAILWPWSPFFDGDHLIAREDVEDGESIDPTADGEEEDPSSSGDERDGAGSGDAGGEPIWRRDADWEPPWPAGTGWTWPPDAAWEHSGSGWSVPPEQPRDNGPSFEEVSYSRPYDRARAVAYAERYWNSHNPAFPLFEVDCTNYVSQCLYAGGIPMLVTGNRNTGWWFRGGRRPSWSFSWAVAHSLYLLLKSGKAPMFARQVDHPSQLEPGDVICYDFDGDGRWQHNTIVVAKDYNGMPLVNAHTTNSRMRYWAYRDSTAYTPRIRYAFFRIKG